MSSRRISLLLIFAVAVGIAVRIVFASGFVGHDDAHYIESAYNIAIGQAAAVHGHFGTRTGLVVPTAALFAAFGIGVPTAVAVPFVCSLVGLFAVFLVGRTLFDDATAAIATLLLALFPLDIIFAACLGPTTPIGLFAGTAICLFALAERVRQPGIFAAAGILLGVAVTFGETPLFSFIAYAVYVATLGRPCRDHLAALVGFLMVVALEIVLSALVYADPLVRLAALARADTVRGTNPDVVEAGWTIEWLLHPWLRIASEQELGLYLLLGVPLALWRLVKSDSRAERTLSLFVVVLFVWISYGTVSPLGYAPLARLPRYFSMFQIPLVLLVALWLRRMTPRAANAVIALIAVTSLLGVTLDGSRSRSAGHEQVGVLIARDRPARVVVAEELLLPFLFFQGFHPPMPVAVLRAGAAEPTAVELEGVRPSDRAVPLSFPRTYFVTRPELHDWLSARGDLQRVARIQPADTLYRRLLRSERFRALLSLTRSRFRMAGLEGRAADSDAIEVWSQSSGP